MKKNVIGIMVVMLALVLITPIACGEAKFELGSLEITPDKTGIGQPVTVAAEVTNTGEAEAIFTAQLKINGETVDSQEVTIASGSKQLVSFRYSTQSVGTHEVELNGLVG